MNAGSAAVGGLECGRLGSGGASRGVALHSQVVRDGVRGIQGGGRAARLAPDGALVLPGRVGEGERCG